MAFALDAAVTVEGTLLRVKFQRADGWSPGDFLLSESRKQTIAVGQWLGVEPGARVRLLGEWQTHPKYGRQFKFSSCEPLEIDTLDDVAAFLAYRVEEIGELRAKRISEHFGAELLSILETTPERLAEVPGISERIAIKVGAAFKSYRAEYELLRGLSKWNLTTLVRKKALREWGFRAPQVLEDDVFNLLLLDGVGFQIADKAREVAGISPTDPRRLAAGATCFQQTGVEGEGSTWIDYDGLVRGVVELVRCTPHEAAVGIASALAKGSLKAVLSGEGGLVPPEDVVDTRKLATASIFSAKAYAAEQSIARFVRVADAKSAARRLWGVYHQFGPPPFEAGLPLPQAVRVALDVDFASIDVEEASTEDGVPLALEGEEKQVGDAIAPVAKIEFPRLIQELAATDSVVHRLVSLAEQNAEADVLYEAIRMELDDTLRRVRDGLLEYLRDGDESAKEQFSLMVERLTAIAVVSTHDAVLGVLGRAQLEKPANWRAE